MAFRILVFFAGVMLALGIGPSPVLGQAPITPDPRIPWKGGGDRDPRLEERTTDGEYRIGTKLELRDSENTWGPNATRDCWASMLLIELGFGHVALDPDWVGDTRASDAMNERAFNFSLRAAAEADRVKRERAKFNEERTSRGLEPLSEAQYEDYLRQEEAKKGGQEAICLTHTTQSEIEVNEFLRVRSAIRNQADALLHSNDPNLMRVSRNLSALAEQIQPPEAGATSPPPPPDPLSFWIHARPPGGAPNPGPGLVFHVASVPAFGALGVDSLSNTFSSSSGWPGSVYAERDQPRTVAPAPSLDPDDWPATGAPALSLTLEEPAP
jgi:hypothetical protein